MIKIAYIIGPYRADSVYDIHTNIFAAETLAAYCALAGVFPYCPHKNTAYLDGLTDDELWLEGNKELLRRGIADIGIVSARYKESSGSLEEIKLCTELNIPLIFEQEYDDPKKLVIFIRRAAYADSVCN